MNNKEFVSTLASRTQMTLKETRTPIEALVQTIAAALEDGDSLTVPSFGNFEVKKKNERIIVNPATKQRQLVPPKLVLAFKPSAALKDKLKN